MESISINSTGAVLLLNIVVDSSISLVLFSVISSSEYVYYPELKRNFIPGGKLQQRRVMHYVVRQGQLSGHILAVLLIYKRTFFPLPWISLPLTPLRIKM